MARKQLSMKRLHIIASQFLISLGVEKGTKSQQLILDFMKYIWENKDSDLWAASEYEAAKSKARTAQKAT